MQVQNQKTFVFLLQMTSLLKSNFDIIKFDFNHIIQHFAKYIKIHSEVLQRKLPPKNPITCWDLVIAIGNPYYAAVLVVEVVGFAVYGNNG